MIKIQSRLRSLRQGRNGSSSRHRSDAYGVTLALCQLGINDSCLESIHWRKESKIDAEMDLLVAKSTGCLEHEIFFWMMISCVWV